jgi:hypothetical protein
MLQTTKNAWSNSYEFSQSQNQNIGNYFQVKKKIVFFSCESDTLLILPFYCDEDFIYVLFRIILVVYIIYCSFFSVK